MAQPTLSIGYEPDFAPLTFMEGQSSAGIAIEIVDEVLRRIGFAVDFVPVELADHDPAIRAGRIRALAFKAITPARAYDYDFSQPMTTGGAAWFFARTGKVVDKRPAPGTRLATPARGPLIAQLKSDFPDLIFVEVDTYAEASRAVIEGSAGCAALNFHIGRYLASRDFSGQVVLPDRPFHKMPISFALDRGVFREVCEEFDRALAEMYATDAIETIERRWLG